MGCKILQRGNIPACQRQHMFSRSVKPTHLLWLKQRRGPPPLRVQPLLVAALPAAVGGQ